jgi:hypothetical protein
VRDEGTNWEKYTRGGTKGKFVSVDKVIWGNRKKLSA